MSTYQIETQKEINNCISCPYSYNRRGQLTVFCPLLYSAVDGPCINQRNPKCPLVLIKK